MSFTIFRPRPLGRAAKPDQDPLPAPAAKPILWALVDCNSFYCSCERLFRPDLAGRPVVVLSNNDGCLISLTPEAKALGYKMGDVFYLLENQLKKDKVAVFSSNYTLYGDISRRVMLTLAGIAPAIDQYSIDEAFVPLDQALADQAEEVGREMCERILRWVGIPVGVGIGPTRTLAKQANLWAKKMNRVLCLRLGSPELEEALEQTPVVDIWGIGRRMTARLNGLGIENARQLRDMEPEAAEKLLTVIGRQTVMELRGEQCLLEDLPTPRKTMISSRSFGRRVSRKEDLAQALAMHCAIAGERLRQEGLVAGNLSIWLTTSRHMKEPYARLSARVDLPSPTNDTRELTRAAYEALDSCYQSGHGFMKGGVMLYELEDAERRQMTLLEAAEAPAREKSRALMAALDQINGKYGRNTLNYLAQGPSDAFWHMRRNKMSGHLTTRWDQLATANADIPASAKK